MIMAGRISSFLYRAFFKFYRIIPCKKFLCLFIRFTKLPVSKYYCDLNFNAFFTIRLKKSTFRMRGGVTALENSVFWMGVYKGWEPETVKVWEVLSKECRVIIDIGANSGLYSLLAKSVNPRCVVYSFEPSEKMRQVLVGNIDNNHFDIFIRPEALSNRLGKADFYDTLYNAQTSASLNPYIIKNQLDKEMIQVYQVPTMTLDHFSDEQKLSALDLIKLDVEMHEAEVVEGGLEAISTFRPFMIVEILNDSIGMNIQKSLQNQNYKYFQLAENKLSETALLTYHPGSFNYLLVPAEKADSPVMKKVYASFLE